jgi:ABC-type uncharacterized transport system substrate-binding protein
MSRKKYIWLGLAITLSIVLLLLLIRKNDDDYVHTDHPPRRILYYEGGPYYDYRNNLLALLEGMKKLKMIEPLDLSKFYNKKSDDNREIWNFVADNYKGHNFIFLKEDFYSSNWDDDIKQECKEKIIKKLNTEDIDLVIAMGTWAGQALANNEHKTNTMVISTTDAVSSGIIEKPNDDRFPHVFVEYDPYIYYRQLKLFYSIFQFKKLGIVYTDTVDGRSYVAYNDILKLSQKENFELVTCTFNGYETDINKLTEDGKECVEAVSAKADAMYFGDQSFMKYEYMPYVIQSTIDNKIPTWSHHGIEHVRRGILMSKAHEHSFKDKGLWQAEIFRDIIHNVKNPSEFDSIWHDKTELAVNLDVANKIGFDVPEAILKISYKVFEKIEDGKDVVN